MFFFFAMELVDGGRPRFLDIVDLRDLGFPSDDEEEEEEVERLSVGLYWRVCFFGLFFVSISMVEVSMGFAFVVRNLVGSKLGLVAETLDEAALP